MLNIFNTFNSIICPFCIKKKQNINIDKNYNEFDLILCNNCGEKFTFIKCPYCEHSCNSLPWIIDHIRSYHKTKKEKALFYRKGG